MIVVDLSILIGHSNHMKVAIHLVEAMVEMINQLCEIDQLIIIIAMTTAAIAKRTSAQIVIRHIATTVQIIIDLVDITLAKIIIIIMVSIDHTTTSTRGKITSSKKKIEAVTHP